MATRVKGKHQTMSRPDSCDIVRSSCVKMGHSSSFRVSFVAKRWPPDGGGGGGGGEFNCVFLCPSNKEELCSERKMLDVKILNEIKMEFSQVTNERHMTSFYRFGPSLTTHV